VTIVAQGQPCRRIVGRRIGVGHRSADGAAMPDLGIADQAGERGEAGLLP